MTGRVGARAADSCDFWGPWVEAGPGFDEARHGAILGTMNARAAGPGGAYRAGTLMLVGFETWVRPAPGSVRREARYRFRLEGDLPRPHPDYANVFRPPWEDWLGILAPGGDQVQVE